VDPVVKPDEMRFDGVVGAAKSALAQVDGPATVACGELDIAGTENGDRSAGRRAMSSSLAVSGSRSIMTVVPHATADAAAMTRTFVISRSRWVGARITRCSSNIEIITVGSIMISVGAESLLWRDCMIDTSSGLLSLPSGTDDIVTDMFQIRAFDNGAEIGIQTVIRTPN
jgi:hypothetical protein